MSSTSVFQQVFQQLPTCQTRVSPTTKPGQFCQPPTQKKHTQGQHNDTPTLSFKSAFIQCHTLPYLDTSLITTNVNVVRSLVRPPAPPPNEGRSTCNRHTTSTCCTSSRATVLPRRNVEEGPVFNARFNFFSCNARCFVRTNVWSSNASNACDKRRPARCTSSMVCSVKCGISVRSCLATVRRGGGRCCLGLRVFLPLLRPVRGPGLERR